jgi:hypothetical protein
MNRRFTYVVLGLIAALALTSTGLAARANGQISYAFKGRLVAAPGNSASLSVDVRGGSKPALRKLVGQGSEQHFAVDANTQYLRWSHGVPTVVDEANLAAGDVVTVRIRAARSASLAQIESTPAWRVADNGATLRRAARPLWLLIGSLEAPAANGHLTLHVQSGNWLGLRKMLGQSLDQTFSYGPRTIFVLWRSGVPTVVSPSQLQVGDRISVRIRAPRAYSLQQAEQVAAGHVGDHEPHTPS